MIINIQQNFEDIISKIKFIQSDVEKNYNEWANKRNTLIEEISGLECKKQTLLDENKHNLEQTKNLESRLKAKEQELMQRQQQVEKMEQDLRNEIEEERKVSIMKNIHQQLKDKTNENELLNRQIVFYKKNNEIFSQLVSKLGLTQEKLSIESIIQAIIEKNSVENTPPIETKPAAAESSAPEEENTNVVEEEEKEKDEEEDEEFISVEDFEYKGVLYYIHAQSGDIYSRLANDEVGDIIGQKDKNGKVRMQRKK
jgi:ribosomal protein L12E/L44/L45/RPP1/RPP2